MVVKKIVVGEHILIPKHSKLSEKEKDALFKEYNLIGRELPSILEDDPGIAALGVKTGDVVKIERVSSTAGTAVFYRSVVSK